MTGRPGAAGPPSHLEPAQLLDLPVRLSAELGRARMPVGEAVALPAGAIVDLDRDPDDPIDVYVNGLRYATARLILIDGEWGIRLERILGGPGAVQSPSTVPSDLGRPVDERDR